MSAALSQHALRTIVALRKAEANYQRAARRAETVRAVRNAAVREALAAGCTHTQIAAATGLTRGRIGQIATAPVD